MSPRAKNFIRKRSQMSSESILERSAIQMGKVFIHEGDEISRAYVIQNGEAVAFTTQDERRVDVETFGPGAIIGELGLVSDEISALSYEAKTLCTVITTSGDESVLKVSEGKVST